MKKLGMALLFACLAYSFIEVSPVNAGVCFVVNGDCGQKITVKPKGCENLGGMEDCVKNGMLPDYESAKQCTSGGVVYTSKCLCDPARFPYTKDGLKDNTYYEAGGKTCKDRTGTYYAWKICRASYKYTLNQNDVDAIKNESPKYHNGVAVCENRSMVPYTTLGCDEKDGVSSSFSRYTKCVCDKSIYKYNSTNKGLYALSGVMCKGTDNVERYTALACPTMYPYKKCTGDLVDAKIMPSSGEANFDCYTCKCAAKFEYPSTLGNNIIGSGNQCDTKWDNYTCPTTYPLQKCTGTTTYACEKITSTVNSKAVCYKQVKKPTCAEIGGLTLAEKNAEPAAKTALYDYKTASQISVDDKGVGCYFRIPKTCNSLTGYAAAPLTGYRVSFNTISFPDAYSGQSVKNRNCFKKKVVCQKGDLLTTKGFCLPKSNSGDVWGWNNTHAFSAYGVDKDSKKGMVTKVETSKLRYVKLTDQYYDRYGHKSMGVAGAGDLADLWNIDDAEVVIANLDSYKTLAGSSNVHNAKRTFVTNKYDGKYGSSIQVKECYFVNYDNKTAYKYIRRVILDPSSSGIVSKSNRNNPRYLYGIHLYAGNDADITKALLYGEGDLTIYKCSKLNDFDPAWDKNAYVQPARIYRALAKYEIRACGSYGTAGKFHENGDSTPYMYMVNAATHDVDDSASYHCTVPMYFSKRNSCNRTHDADTCVPEKNCWHDTMEGKQSINTVTHTWNYIDWDKNKSRWGIQGCYVKTYGTMNIAN